MTNDSEQNDDMQTAGLLARISELESRLADFERPADLVSVGDQADKIRQQLQRIEDLEADLELERIRFATEIDVVTKLNADNDVSLADEVARLSGHVAKLNQLPENFKLMRDEVLKQSAKMNAIKTLSETVAVLNDEITRLKNAMLAMNQMPENMKKLADNVKALESRDRQS